MQALEGLRVLDFSQGMAGPLATMILADYGAEVIRVEPEGGDPHWADPAYRLWNRGKKSIILDLHSPEGRRSAQELIRSADVLLESLPPGEAERLGIGYDAAASIHPALVYVSISAFGQQGPYRDLKAYDGIVNAKSGRMRDQPGANGPRPHYRAVNDTSYHTAMVTVQSILAGLRVAWMTGRGQWIETSLLRGLTAPNNPWRRFEGEELPPDGYPGKADADAVQRGELVADRKENDPQQANPAMLCVECRDGRWIMHSFLQAEMFRVWIDDVLQLGWIWDDPRYQGAPNTFPTDDDRVGLNLLIRERMLDKDSEEWITLYRLHPDCAGEVMRTTQEAFGHPQFIANGHRVEILDPVFGRMAQVGPFVKMTETPADIGTPAPLPGQHTDEILTSIRAPSRSSAELCSTVPKAPLEGIMMIELASWLAAPFAGALMADLGARVVKVEPVHGDPYRQKITNENMIRTMQGKESIALDLKTPEGLEILHKLVERADIVMHNFRPGVPERIGMDYRTLQQLNPDLIYLHATAFGSAGPDAKRAAYNPVIGAFTGNSVFQSGDGNIPMGDQSPDPIGGSGVATGIMLGLAARLRTGKGQYLETSMMNSCVYCNSDDAFDYDGKPPRRVPDGRQLGLAATYRLYETSHGWVFFAAPTDGEFRSFCTAASCEELMADERFVSAAGRYEHRDELGSALEKVFASRPAPDWETALTAAGVACVRADGMGHKRFLHEDPHTRAIGFMVPTENPMWSDRAPGGRYWRHGPIANFSLTPCIQGTPYSNIGQNTKQILAELGYPDEEILRLGKTGIVAWPKEPETDPL